MGFSHSVLQIYSRLFSPECRASFGRRKQGRPAAVAATHRCVLWRSACPGDVRLIPLVRLITGPKQIQKTAAVRNTRRTQIGVLVEYQDVPRASMRSGRVLIREAIIPNTGNRSNERVVHAVLCIPIFHFHNHDKQSLLPFIHIPYLGGGNPYSIPTSCTAQCDYFPSCLLATHRRAALVHSHPCLCNNRGQYGAVERGYI